MPKKPFTQKEPLKELNLFILLFKIEGHTTWRANQFPTKKAFDIYLTGQPKHPKVTDKKWFIVDRINGTVKED